MPEMKDEWGVEGMGKLALLNSVIKLQINGWRDWFCTSVMKNRTCTTSYTS